MKIAIVVVVGLAAAFAYVLWVRPMLERFGVVRSLTPQFVSMRERISAWIGNSWTIAWNTLVGFVATVFTTVLAFADTLQMPDIKQQVVQVFKDYPEGVTAGFLAVAIITAIARKRTL